MVFQSLLSTELSPQWIVLLLGPDPLESLLLFMSVSLPLLWVGFLPTVLTCDSFLEPHMCRQLTMPRICVPWSLHSPKPLASEYMLNNMKAQPLCLLLGQTLKWNLCSSTPLREPGWSWLPEISFAWLLPFPCLASLLESESYFSVCFWNSRPKTPHHAFAHPSIKKSLIKEQAIFCFTYTFSHSTNCSETGMALFQWDHLCKSSLYAVGAIEVWVISQIGFPLL